jgi:hypothetical protein
LTSLVATRAAASELAQARSDLAATQLIVQSKADAAAVYDRQTVDQRIQVAVAPFRSADLQSQIDSTQATKTEVLAALALKADISSVYSKETSDVQLAGKASVADLATLSSAVSTALAHKVETSEFQTIAAVTESRIAQAVVNANQGPTGPAGMAGVAGAAGPQGPAGAAGPTGSDGAVGPQGPQGVAGPQGAVGPQGPQGAQGVAGVGVTGPAGPAGAAGATGPAGSGGSIGTLTKYATQQAANSDVALPSLGLFLIGAQLYQKSGLFPIAYNSSNILTTTQLAQNITLAPGLITTGGSGWSLAQSVTTNFQSLWTNQPWSMIYKAVTTTPMNKCLEVAFDVGITVNQANPAHTAYFYCHGPGTCILLQNGSEVPSTQSVNTGFTTNVSGTYYCSISRDSAGMLTISAWDSNQNLFYKARSNSVYTGTWTSTRSLFQVWDDSDRRQYPKGFLLNTRSDVLTPADWEQADFTR